MTLTFMGYQLNVFLVFNVILHERSERSERSEVKGIKNRHKKISPARIWMGVRVSVCLSVCLCVCLSVRIKKLNNF